MKLGKIGAARCHITFSLCLFIVFPLTPGLIGELLRVSKFEEETVLQAETGSESGGSTSAILGFCRTAVKFF